MATVAPATWSQQHQVLVSEIRYWQDYHTLCQRFYARADLVLNVAQVASGSAAILSAWEKVPVPAWATSPLALAWGIITIAAIFWQPAVRAERHSRAAASCVELYGKAWRSKTVDLQARLAAVLKDAPLGLRSLEMPAFHRTVRSLGQRPTERLTVFEWLCDAFA